MEVLWNIEDQLKISTPKAIALLFCTSALSIGLCIVAALKRRSRRNRLSMDGPMERNWPGPVKKILMDSVEWCGASKKGGTQIRGSGRESPSPLLIRDGANLESHNSDSQVWQRPILMGDKCELPRFSGLILYDEKGVAVHYNNRDTKASEDKTAEFERTTKLRDLLC